MVKSVEFDTFVINSLSVSNAAVQNGTIKYANSNFYNGVQRSQLSKSCKLSIFNGQPLSQLLWFCLGDYLYCRFGKRYCIEWVSISRVRSSKSLYGEESTIPTIATKLVSNDDAIVVQFEIVLGIINVVEQRQYNDFVQKLHTLYDKTIDNITLLTSQSLKSMNERNLHNARQTICEHLNTSVFDHETLCKILFVCTKKMNTNFIYSYVATSNDNMVHCQLKSRTFLLDLEITFGEI